MTKLKAWWKRDELNEMEIGDIILTSFKKGTIFESITRFETGWLWQGLSDYGHTSQFIPLPGNGEHND